jgi:hypothetical protein
MTIKSAKQLEGRRLEIDLTGPNGNAFVLLGMVKNLGRQIGMTDEEIDALRADMRSGNYEHLVEVFEEAFGDYVDLYR